MDMDRTYPQERGNKYNKTGFEVESSRKQKEKPAMQHLPTVMGGGNEGSGIDLAFNEQTGTGKREMVSLLHLVPPMHQMEQSK